MANDFRSARFWARELIQPALYPGARAVDATMGNGHDTLALCELVGEGGHVYAFDVQPEAVYSTRARLEAAGVLDRATLICAGHEHIAERTPEPVDAIVFNLGWLPGAEHGVTTRTETTLSAVHQALETLKEDGVMTICIYPGHAEGARERDALMEWAKGVDPQRFDVLIKSYLNQPNDPPLMLAVHRLLARKNK